MERILHILKNIVFTVLYFFCQSLIAQQSILLNQASYNLFTLNPAAIGINSRVEVNAHYKKNWSGLSESPEVLQLTVEGNIPKSKMGLGLNILNEKAGIFSKSTLLFAFNYKVKFAKEHQVYFGLSFGFQKIQSDFSKIKADQPEEFSVWPQLQAVTNPDGSVGFLYQFRKLSLGISAIQLFPRKYTYREPVYNTKLNYSPVSYFVFCLSYKINLKKKELQLIPQFCLRTPQGLPIQLDFLNTLLYKEKLFLGVGYRNNFALYMNLGYSVNDKLRIMYSYEYGLGIQTYSKGGHEIGIKYTFSESNRNYESVTGNNSDEPIDQLYQELDEQKQNINELNKKIDSLDRNLQVLKKQMENLKNQQIESNAMTSLSLNQHKNDRSIQEKKEGSQQNKKNSLQKNQSNTYNKVNLDEEDELFEMKDTLMANYQIVLGVYQLLNYAKDYQKFLKRELNFETVLFQMPDHPKNFIYVTLAKKYNNLDEALMDLEKTNEITRTKSIEITKGESWVLQTRIK